jgi:hypothetical protein
MHAPRVSFRIAALAVSALAAGVSSGCTDQAPDSLTGPVGPQQDGILAAVAAQELHNDELLRIPGVIGTAVGLDADGQPLVRVFAAHGDVRGVPARVGRVRARLEVTGMFLAFSDPTTRQRPAPLGFSVGHPAITAGTIGARVRDAAGNVYVLSNNHVLANGNNAGIGDAALQPGPYDGGTYPADRIGTLAAFKPIVFSGSASNTIDAAIALSSTADLDNTTPLDDGYGAPAGAIFGDANQDGVFDNKNALLGLAVQKYGRTTGRTTGEITGINATVTICYEVMWIFCTKSARFVDQLIIEPGTFSDGGDSGSLIVTNDGNRQPVGLLFAGSTTQTIANRIDLVLNQFGVTIDAEAGPPPEPVTDVAVTAVSGPATVTQGAVASVTVTVRNMGNEATGGFDVTLHDATDGVPVGTQTVGGLGVGAQTTLTFPWNTAGSSLGTHTLTARHTLADDDAANDERSTTVTVNPPESGNGIHVGDLDGVGSRTSYGWSATVEVTVHDASHNPINGATVVGLWNPAGLASDECTTGELGGTGTCIFLNPFIPRRTRSATFTVTGVAMAGKVYQAAQNHDVDGSSNGTVVTVQRP